uniref:Uncharacterized protein n=1 Tax=Oryza nivara TaxID=4536 RepID=A0A0E0ID49_ORYNI
MTSINCNPATLHRSPINRPIQSYSVLIEGRGEEREMDVVTFGVVVGILVLLFVLVLVVTIEGVCKRRSSS